MTSPSAVAGHSPTPPERAIPSAKEICKLTRDTTIHAEYAPNIYVVRFDVAGGDPLKQGTILATYDTAYR